LSAASRRVGDSWCLVVVFNFVGWGEWDCNSTATASADRRGTGGVRLLSGQAGPGQVRSGQAVRGTAYKLQLADGTGGACRETSARLARLGSTQVSICRSEQERACRTAVLIRRANTRGKLTLHSTQAFRLSLCPRWGPGQQTAQLSPGKPTSQLPAAAHRIRNAASLNSDTDPYGGHASPGGGPAPQH
jgi:hypothetical protein